MDRQHGRALENEQDLIAGRARLERSADVTARAARVEVGAGRVERDAEQLRDLSWQHSTAPGVRGHLHARLGPGWIRFPALPYRRCPCPRVASARHDPSP